MRMQTHADACAVAYPVLALPLASLSMTIKSALQSLHAATCSLYSLSVASVPNVPSTP